MKVLVTGATGFLGSHLIEALRVEHEVVALCRRAQHLPVPVCLGDLDDVGSLVAAMEGCQAVVHAAGSVSHQPHDAQLMWRTHVQGTQHVLDAAVEAGVARVVLLSSSGTVAVSKDASFMGSETSPTPLELIKDWPYYRAKLFAEQEALARTDVEVVALNPSLLLGPGDRRGSSTRIVGDFLEHRIPAVPPGGLSFADARDVADAARSALTQGRPGRRYLLGSANLTFSEFFSKLARIVDRKPPRVVLPSATRKVLAFLPELGRDGASMGMALDRAELELACHTWYLDDTRARNELGWSPRDPMATLRDTVSDLGGHTAWMA